MLGGDIYICMLCNEMCVTYKKVRDGKNKGKLH